MKEQIDIFQVFDSYYSVVLKGYYDRVSSNGNQLETFKLRFCYRVKSLTENKTSGNILNEISKHRTLFKVPVIPQTLSYPVFK